MKIFVNEKLQLPMRFNPSVTHINRIRVFVLKHIECVVDDEMDNLVVLFNTSF